MKAINYENPMDKLLKYKIFWIVSTIKIGIHVSLGLFITSNRFSYDKFYFEDLKFEQKL